VVFRSLLKTFLWRIGRCQNGIHASNTVKYGSVFVGESNLFCIAWLDGMAFRMRFFPSSFNLKGTGEEAWISGVPGGWAGYELFASK
jgi:hypothetical protein